MFPPPVSEESLEEIMFKIKQKFSTKPKIAIAGFGKAGKSSLFNAIYGENVAKVSMRTDEIQRDADSGTLWHRLYGYARKGAVYL